MSYNNYLKSSHWKNTRKDKLSMCNHCQICDIEKNLHIHHKRYEISEKEAELSHKRLPEKIKAGSILCREEMKDLMVLCASCHKLWHSYFGKRYLTHKKANQIRRLIKYGVVKNKAFMVTKNFQLYTPILLEAKRRLSQPSRL